MYYNPFCLNSIKGLGFNPNYAEFGKAEKTSVQIHCLLARTRFLVFKIFNYFLWYIIFPFLAGKFYFFVPNYVPIKVTFIIIISAIMVSIFCSYF